MADTLPLYCQFCGTALAVEVAPLPPDTEDAVSVWACPACQKANQGKLNGRVVAVRVRVDGPGKVGRVH